MSCIAGAFQFDGKPVTQALLADMLAPAHATAPDGDAFVRIDQIAMGQAFLRTGASPAEQPNATTLDGKCWIVADARLDGREELARKLRGRGRGVSAQAPHAELILQAFEAFGDSFLDHLIGDFAFAIWDSRRRQLTCARDHFGVRPFHYACTGSGLLFASRMDSLLAAGVGSDLDPASVADFLLFGMSGNADQTIYRAVRCLPPASRLLATPGGITVDKYWEMPERTRTWLAPRGDYVEKFSGVFREAVRDRLPGGPVGIQLSGGMDSTSIASCACAAGAQPRMTAYHLSCRSVVPEDDEGDMATLVAARLHIPLVRQDISDHPLFSTRDGRTPRTQFPLAYPHLGVQDETFRKLEQSGARVLIAGYSGDAALLPSATYYRGLVRRGRWGSFLREAAHQWKHAGDLRRMGLRGLLRGDGEVPEWKPALPGWLSPDLMSSAQLRQRWEWWWTDHQRAVDAPRQFRLPWIHRQFEATEALDFPVVARYPFNDLRVIDCLQSLPNFMLRDKTILREAMAGSLPEEVLRRPKTGLAGDHVRAIVTNGKLRFADLLGGLPMPPAVMLEKYAEAWERYCRGEGADSTWATWLMLQPLGLAIWLSERPNK